MLGLDSFKFTVIDYCRGSKKSLQRLLVISTNYSPDQSAEGAPVLQLCMENMTPLGNPKNLSDILSLHVFAHKPTESAKTRIYESTRKLLTKKNAVAVKPGRGDKLARIGSKSTSNLHRDSRGPVMLGSAEGESKRMYVDIYVKHHHLLGGRRYHLVSFDSERDRLRFMDVVNRYAPHVAVKTFEPGLASVCYICSRDFSMGKRRLVCKSCHKVVCRRCKKHRVSLPELGFEESLSCRVCDECFKDIHSSRVEDVARKMTFLETSEMESLSQSGSIDVRTDIYGIILSDRPSVDANAAPSPKAVSMTTIEEEKIRKQFHWVAERTKVWEEYLLQFPDLKNTPQLKALIRKGIPPQLRGHVWRVISGAEELRALYAVHYYPELLAEGLQAAASGEKDASLVQIEKDVRRTFPSHVLFENDSGLTPLRNVLISYSRRNPLVGYCQSMNFIVACLLLFMEEEDAFWMLCVIAEKVTSLEEVDNAKFLYGRPDPSLYYYQSDLGGFQVDHEVLQDLVAQKLPKVVAKLSAMELQLAPITMKWMLSLLVHTLPLDFTLRVWDCIFMEGPKVMFRACIAVLKLRQKEILRAETFGQLVDILSQENILKGHTDDDFLRLCFDTRAVGSFSHKLLDKLRAKHIQALSSLMPLKKTALKDVLNQRYREKYGEELPEVVVKKRTEIQELRLRKQYALIRKSVSFRGFDAATEIAQSILQVREKFKDHSANSLDVTQNEDSEAESDPAIPPKAISFSINDMKLAQDLSSESSDSVDSFEDLSDEKEDPQLHTNVDALNMTLSTGIFPDTANKNMAITSSVWTLVPCNPTKEPASEEKSDDVTETEEDQKVPRATKRKSDDLKNYSSGLSSDALIRMVCAVWKATDLQTSGENEEKFLDRFGILEATSELNDDLENYRCGGGEHCKNNAGAALNASDKKYYAMGSYWHTECFTCGKCSAPLAYKSFVVSDGHFYCIQDAPGTAAPQCLQCKRDVALADDVLQIQKIGVSPELDEIVHSGAEADKLFVHRTCLRCRKEDCLGSGAFRLDEEVYVVEGMAVESELLRDTPLSVLCEAHHREKYPPKTCACGETIAGPCVRILDTQEAYHQRCVPITQLLTLFGDI